MNRLLFITLFLSGCFGPRVLGGEPCVGGSVHLRIVSTFGVRAHKARLTFTNVVSRQVNERSFGYDGTTTSDVFTVTGLACGEYSLRVRTPILDTTDSTTELSIKPEEQWLTLAYPFDKPIDHYGESPTASLFGVVKCCVSKTGRGWVRIVGVFTKESREMQVDSNGSFSFSAIPEGIYVVILTWPDSEPITRCVRVRTGVNQMELLMPKAQGQDAMPEVTKLLPLEAVEKTHMSPELLK